MEIWEYEGSGRGTNTSYGSMRVQDGARIQAVVRVRD